MNSVAQSTLKTTNKHFHPRIQQLNRELLEERTKRFDYVWLNHRGERYRVCVERRQDGDFFASAKCVGRVFRTTHDTPSGAIGHLIRQMNWALDRWVVAENDRLRSENARLRKERRAA